MQTVRIFVHIIKRAKLPGPQLRQSSREICGWLWFVAAAFSFMRSDLSFRRKPYKHNQQPVNGISFFDKTKKYVPQRSYLHQLDIIRFNDCVGSVCRFLWTMPCINGKPPTIEAALSAGQIAHAPHKYQITGRGSLTAIRCHRSNQENLPQITLPILFTMFWYVIWSKILGSLLCYIGCRCSSTWTHSSITIAVCTISTKLVYNYNLLMDDA